MVKWMGNSAIGGGEMMSTGDEGKWAMVSGIKRGTAEEDCSLSGKGRRDS